MHYDKISNTLSPKSVNNRRSSIFIPILVAVLYGAMVFQVSAFTTLFLSRLDTWDSLFLIGLSLSGFAAVCLWPVLIRFGNGATISELRSQLSQSEEAVHSLKNNTLKLTDELKGFENELSRSYRYFGHLLKTFGMATFYCDSKNRIEWAYNSTVENDDVVGKWIDDVIPVHASGQVVKLMRKAMDDGEIHDGQIELLVDGDQRKYDLQVAPRHDRSGKVIGTMFVSRDVTEKARWNDHLATMTLEVNHRARNLLAIVVSLLGQTAKSVSSVADYKSKVLTRVSSLAKSIELISDDSWTASSLQKLVEIQIKHVAGGDADRVQIDGQCVKLKSKAIQNIGLAIHELASNSKNHGALATPDGHVSIAWILREQDSKTVLGLQWKENWGREKTEPAMNGFGLQILKNIVAQELTGDSRWTWNRTGLEYEMVIPNTWLDGHTSA